VREVRRLDREPGASDPERQLELCMQCHLETTSMNCRGRCQRSGRGVFSFSTRRAAGRLRLYFDHPRATGYDDKFELVSSLTG